MYQYMYIYFFYLVSTTTICNIYICIYNISKWLTILIPCCTGLVVFYNIRFLVELKVGQY